MTVRHRRSSIPADFGFATGVISGESSRLFFVERACGSASATRPRTAVVASLRVHPDAVEGRAPLACGRQQLLIGA